MDWTLAVEINRRALLQLLATLLDRIGVGETVTRRARSFVLSRLLRAESAARRLIAIAAIGLTVPARGKRAGPTGAIPEGSGDREAVFPLIDPRRRVGPPKRRTVPGFGPNVRGLDRHDPAPPCGAVLSPDDLLPSRRLARRLAALRRALEDIPAQARRLARMTAAMERPIRAMRPGRPPGHRACGREPVDLLLAECHGLALMALAEVPP